MTALAPRTSTRVLSVLQWLGILAVALTWAAQHVVGYGAAEARCSIAGMHWGIGLHAWDGAMLACAAAVAVAAETAALTVFVRTRGGDFGDGPLERPDSETEARLGRLHFFAAAALVTNLLFLTIVLLDTSASLADTLCRQS
jgi:hypothetical protein